MENVILDVRKPALKSDEAAITRLLYEVAACFKTGNIDKAISLHTNDVVLMESNMPLIQGKAAMKAFFTEFFNEVKSKGTVVHLDFTIAEMEILLPRAFMRGQVILQKTNPGMEPVVVKGKFFCLFAKQPDGSWLRSHIMSNTDGAEFH